MNFEDNCWGMDNAENSYEEYTLAHGKIPGDDDDDDDIDNDDDFDYGDDDD